LSAGPAAASAADMMMLIATTNELTRL
jgi:hypothetical protein